MTDGKASVSAPFWKDRPLDGFTEAEWESLCDGCGKCCLNKLIDADDPAPDTEAQVLWTNVACKALDCRTGLCGDYANRFRVVPECLNVKPETLPEIANWLPETCAYRRLYKGEELPGWHPLLTGDPASVAQAGHSVAGRSVSEEAVPDDQLEDHIISWIS